MRIKRKTYTEYSEAPEGVSVQEVITDYVLEPTGVVLDYVEKSPMGNLDGIKRKTIPLKSIKNYIKWRLSKDKKAKN